MAAVCGYANSVNTYAQEMAIAKLVRKNVVLDPRTLRRAQVILG